jgi:hypothetical protein
MSRNVQRIAEVSTSINEEPKRLNKRNRRDERNYVKVKEEELIFKGGNKSQKWGRKKLNNRGNKGKQ